MTTTTIIIAAITVITLLNLLINIEGMMYCEYTPPASKKELQQATLFSITGYRCDRSHPVARSEHFTS